MQEERRKDYIMFHDEIQNLDTKIQLLQARYDSEFGSKEKEGSIYAALRSIKEILDSQKTRVNVLDNWRWFIVGCIAVISSVISISVPILFGVFEGIKNDIKENSDYIKGHIEYNGFNNHNNHNNHKNYAV